MEISDDLLCLYTARIERRDGAPILEVPRTELDAGDLSEGETYRVALFGESSDDERSHDGQERSPPVEEGEVRTVEIEGLGDQGDGIARVDRGYVVIVPGTTVGDEVEVEIQELRPNFAMASVVR